MWADWVWPISKDIDIVKLNFYSLLIGKHPAGLAALIFCVWILLWDRSMTIIFSFVLSIAKTAASSGIR